MYNVHEKLLRKYSYRNCLQNNAQRRYFVVTYDSKPLSLTIERDDVEFRGIFRAPRVHTDVLLTNITSTPHNPTGHQQYWLTIVSDHKISALSIFLQTISVGIFFGGDFHARFAVGRVFIEP